MKVYPNYELYDGCPLRENDVLVVAVYLNLLAMAEFALYCKRLFEHMILNEELSFGEEFEILKGYRSLRAIMKRATARTVSVQKGNLCLKGEVIQSFLSQVLYKRSMDPQYIGSY